MNDVSREKKQVTLLYSRVHVITCFLENLAKGEFFCFPLRYVCFIYIDDRL